MQIRGFDSITTKGRSGDEAKKKPNFSVSPCYQMRNEKCIYILMGQTDWIGASVGGGGGV